MSLSELPIVMLKLNSTQKQSGTDLLQLDWWQKVEVGVEVKRLEEKQIII
jgi:hypothetical protein